MGDECAMNLKCVDVFFWKFLLFCETFCAWGAKFAENGAAPSVGI
jgi:hypothetical protein